MRTSGDARSGSGEDPSARTLTIERLAAGGDGVGRIGAKVAFVPLTAPGDLAEVNVVRDRGSWCRARLARLVRPGPARVSPVCPAFGDCGGCDWQHVAYRAQLKAKRSIVEDALRRIGRLETARVPEVVPSPQQLGYRHRARLHLEHARGALRLGFYRRGSRAVVPLASCPVLHPALNAALAALGEALRLAPEAFAGIGELRLAAGWEGPAVRVHAVGERGGPSEIAAAAVGPLLAAAARGGVRVLLGAAEREPLALGPGPLALQTTGETFTQVNLRQNARLVELVSALAAPAPGEAALDLFCGLGNLALPAAREGARVTGVDRDAKAVRQARENALRLGLDATFLRADAAVAARELAAAGRRYALVLLNPPRTGARDVVAAVPALAPSRVLIVSCDPATLARDAAVLAAAGFALASAQPLDLFPQTAHVETVALFRAAP